MIFRRAAAALFLCSLAGSALAQQAKAPPQPGQVEAQSLGLAIQQGSTAAQQIANAAHMFADEMQRLLAAKDTRIAELEKLCGDACKPKAEKPEAKPAAKVAK